ncbi:MAG: bifunctional ornithine acetyltransferase/N-acetylglutamate synthase [Clostridia bacterium]|nr:bifunctional ornithine acetyltransferase/N-acetylglutamate synthase [Clostridia bacterium]
MDTAEYKKIDGGITSVKGFKAAGIHCGIKKVKLDLALIYSSEPCAAAGVFTKNVVRAAPIIVSQEYLEGGSARAVVVNSGVANACTGEKGMEDARKMAKAAGEALHVDPREVVVASTGVIGTALPMDQLLKGINDAADQLSVEGDILAAEAIMTTDTFPKVSAIEAKVGGSPVVFGGMAKGSGMIHPNMATMLGFITTDAAITPSLLKKALQKAVDRSFNMITVDGDTSTNDMVVILANGTAENTLIDTDGEDFHKFEKALEYICVDLAKMIVKDGEGATKFAEVVVKGAPSAVDARTIAMSVASSNLVKTAIFGEDANWGRILAAAGYSGVDFDPDKVDVFLEGSPGIEQVAVKGSALDFSEEKASEILREEQIKILIDLNQGEGKGRAWTCDLTYDYVKINASYRS